MTIAELRKQCEYLGPLSDVYELKEGQSYIAFIDPRMIDVQALAGLQLRADVDMQIIPILPAPGQTIDDAIRIYQEKTK